MALQLEPLNHVSIPTANVERSKTFYRDTLGFRELKRPNFGFGGAWMLFPGGQPGGQGLMLHIVEKENRPVNNEREAASDIAGIRRSYHLCFQVVDIQAAMQSLQKSDIPFTTNTVPDTDITQVFFFDPDGNGIELGNCGSNMPALLEA